MGPWFTLKQMGLYFAINIDNVFDGQKSSEDVLKNIPAKIYVLYSLPIHWGPIEFGVA